MRFVDDAVLSALSLVNMDLNQEASETAGSPAAVHSVPADCCCGLQYRQAVLLGCGLDSRPFRYGRCSVWRLFDTPAALVLLRMLLLNSSIWCLSRL